VRPTRTAVALAAYLAISLLYFGIPVAAHPGRDWIGFGADPQIFVWSLGWWPHAILHGQNPILAHSVWPPVGLNLAWVSSIPGLAIAFAPVTLLAGPVAAYNVASILMPALAAWTAFLLCRYLTRSFWPALAGGYLFGFSSYMLGQLEGHMHVSSVFLLPLAALVVLRYLEGSLTGRGLTWRLGLLLAAQILLSTEVLFTLTLALAAALVGAFAFVPSMRARLRTLPQPLVGAYLIAGVITSPLLGYAVAHFQRESINKPADFPADLVNLLVPTRLTALSTGWTHNTSVLFAGNTAENGAYLGLPLIVILVIFAWTKRGSAQARLLTLLIGLGVLCELGTALHTRGDRHLALPWRIVSGLPGFDNVLPVRLSVYVALAASVAAAWWAASAAAPRWARAGLVTTAVIAIAPAFWIDAWHTRPNRPAFFSTGIYKKYLEPNETVLLLPYPSLSGSMLWQAEAGFRFRAADASLSPVIPDGLPDRQTVLAVRSNDTPKGGGAAILMLARAQGVGAIVVDAGNPEPWRTLLEGSGLPGRELGGIYLYRVTLSG
jgi:hypothetical protein